MYQRRKQNIGPREWFIGIGIVIVVVSVFFVIQNRSTVQTAIQPTQTLLVVKTAVPKATSNAAIQNQARLAITADKIGMVADIRELYYDNNGSWDVAALGLFAGHLQGTAQLLQGGNYVLAGHVELKDGSNGPFGKIHLLEPGDEISIVDLSNSKNLTLYRVTDVKQVEPNDISVIRNHGYEELTLITCNDWDASTNVYRTRLVVHAQPYTTKKKSS